MDVDLVDIFLFRLSVRPSVQLSYLSEQQTVVVANEPTLILFFLYKTRLMVITKPHFFGRKVSLSRRKWTKKRNEGIDCVVGVAATGFEYAMRAPPLIDSIAFTQTTTAVILFGS